jgi:hypothetical protein
MGSWAKRAAAALAVFTLTALPAVAQVPSPFARELAGKLARAEGRLTENGYARAAGPFPGALSSGETRRQTVMLRAGQDYRVVGVCDRNCGNFDIRVFDPNNRLIAQDVLQDNIPVVHVVPALTGQYSIEPAMARCNAEQCWYAFNVYSR